MSYIYDFDIYMRFCRGLRRMNIFDQKMSLEITFRVDNNLLSVYFHII